jgi:hypothetical protein
MQTSVNIFVYRDQLECVLELIKAARHGQMPPFLQTKGVAEAAQKFQSNGRPGPAMGIFSTASYATSSSPMKKRIV